MCQLFAMNGFHPADARFSFSGFTQRAGKTGNHVDGFGMAFFEGSSDDLSLGDKGVRVFVDSQSALHSPVAKMIQSYPIKSRQVIAHIRKATKGGVALQNCHPFVRELWGRYWVFAHNGDLESFSPNLHSSFSPVGDTDSELAFCWMMQELLKSHAGIPSVAELTKTLRDLMRRIASFGTFNCLFSNGEALWVHTSTKPESPQLYMLERHYPFGNASLIDNDISIDLAQHNGVDDKMVIVATEPLTRDEAWVPLVRGELCVFVNGECLPL